jgi:hypothetical protein
MFLSLLLELYNISKTKENKITNNISTCTHNVNSRLEKNRIP